MVYAYARVSSRLQNEDRQLIAFRSFADKEYGTEDISVYVDKQSGKDFERTNYKKLMGVMRQGDVLLLKSIDRLGRNYEEMLREWMKITKEMGCDIVVLDMPLLDTRHDRDLTGTLIADIVLQLLSYVAHTERDFIRQRQAEGIAAAKAMGVRFGRPEKVRPKEYEAMCDAWRSGRITLREAASNLGVAHTTFMRWMKRDEKQIPVHNE